MKYTEIEPKAKMVTRGSMKVILKNGTNYLGFFHNISKSPELAKKNMWAFIEHNNSVKFRNQKDESCATIINGEDILEIKYPA